MRQILEQEGHVDDGDVRDTLGDMRRRNDRQIDRFTLAHEAKEIRLDAKSLVKAVLQLDLDLVLVLVHKFFELDVGLGKGVGRVEHRRGTEDDGLLSLREARDDGEDHEKTQGYALLQPKSHIHTSV